MSAAALSGLRVLDLAGEPGLYATKLLADLGADVVRIDPPSARSDPRSLLSRDPRARGLAYFNSGKRSVTLDLASERGRDLFRRLAAGADVVCETEAPGALRDLGIGFERLREENEKLVWVSITPFGQSGPRRHWKGSNLVGWALSSVPPTLGEPDRAPLAPAASQPLAYLLASMNAAAGTLLALRVRRRTGRGQRVDVSVHESTVAASSEVGPVGFLDDLVPRRRTGNRRPSLPPTGIFPTSDGHAAVVILAVTHWDALARWIVEKTGNEAVLDPLFRDVIARREVGALLEEWTEALTVQYSKQELFEEGQRRGISITPVNRIDDVFRDAQLAARRFWVEVDDPVAGRVRMAGGPYKLGRTPWRTSAPPLPGEHNEAVYRELLGLAEQELEALARAGVV